MARLFSLNFQFQHKEYTALIAVSTNGNGSAGYTASVYDDKGLQVLPQGQLSFQKPDNLQMQEVEDAQVHALLNSLSSALHHRLEEIPTAK